MNPESRKQGLDDDLDHYINAFKGSSDRSRYALYVVMVATVLLAVANYNIQSWSWPVLRMKAWFNWTPPVDSMLIQAPHLEPGSPSGILEGTSLSAKEAATEEYLKQYVARSLLNSSPLPGLSIDANDLGTIGGLALLLLMITLMLSMVREHENLYLSLYKVRMLCTGDEDPGRGESKANLLYHALAMSQVLSSPPTLARWRRKGIGYIVSTALAIPFVAYVWIVFTSQQASTAREPYGPNLEAHLTVQTIIALGLLYLSSITILLSRAMNERWKSAFFRVNPTRKIAPQRPLHEWLKIPLPRRFLQTNPRLRAQVHTGLIDQLRFPKKESTSCKLMFHDISAGEIKGSEIEEVVKILIKKGNAIAQEKCPARGDFKLARFTCHKSLLKIENGEGSQKQCALEVEGDWEIEFYLDPREKSGLTSHQTEAEPSPPS